MFSGLDLYICGLRDLVLRLCCGSGFGVVLLLVPVGFVLGWIFVGCGVQIGLCWIDFVCLVVLPTGSGALRLRFV